MKAANHWLRFHNWCASFPEVQLWVLVKYLWAPWGPLWGTLVYSLHLSLLPCSFKESAANCMLSCCFQTPMKTLLLATVWEPFTLSPLSLHCIQPLGNSVDQLQQWKLFKGELSHGCIFFYLPIAATRHSVYHHCVLCSNSWRTYLANVVCNYAVLKVLEVH